MNKNDCCYIPKPRFLDELHANVQEHDDPLTPYKTDIRKRKDQGDVDPELKSYTTDNWYVRSDG